MIAPHRAIFHRLLDRRAERLARRLAPHLQRGESLLDIGSGAGHNARALGWHTGGTCREADVVDFHVVGPGPILFDGLRLPFPDGGFDVCTLAFVLGYADDPKGLLREAGRAASRRVLLLQSTCRGRWGRAIFFGRRWLQGPAAFLACRALGLIPPVPHRLRTRWTFAREDVEALIAEVGLTLVSVEPEPGPGPLGSISRDLYVIDPRPAFFTDPNPTSPSGMDSPR